MTASLPTVTTPVIIDGTTQPGFTSTPLVVLNGASAGVSTVGLTLAGGNSTVMGLVIDGFGSDGIELETVGNDLIQGNYIGTDYTGAAAVPNGSLGIFVNGVSSNTIGGTTASTRIIISGNTVDGVGLFNAADGNKVEGNYIGVTANGLIALGNGGAGVKIFSGASNNQIGTAGADGSTLDAAEANVISGNCR